MLKSVFLLPRFKIKKLYLDYMPLLEYNIKCMLIGGGNRIAVGPCLHVEAPSDVVGS